jgi:formylglycine-generating enzyme required for sulfatase activity
VKVGDYWIDKYEASVWNNPGCATRQYGISRDDWNPPDDGNWGADETGYACSLAGVPPSRFMTWFQAQQSCLAAGKVLCSNAEWQAAAYGAPDPSSESPCRIRNDILPNGAVLTETKEIVLTGSAAMCISSAGANDMIGNLSEWVADWMQGGLTHNNGDNVPGLPVWPETYYGDFVWNINGTADRTGNGDFVPGLPAAMVRGGSWMDNTAAGVYAASLEYGPSATSARIGVRCCLR